MAQRLAQRGRVLDRRDAVGMARRAVRGAGRPGDPQQAGVGADLVGEPAGGGGAQYGSPGAGPAVASRSAALSRTERVSACSTAFPPIASPYSGPSGFLARVGLRPNKPQADAG